MLHSGFQNPASFAMETQIKGHSKDNRDQAKDLHPICTAQLDGMMFVIVSKNS